MDSLSPEARSRVMAAIRGRDTQPELLLRRALFARGYRYRVNAPGLPGRPDLKLTRHGALILVHGCFWHGHDCERFRLPGSRVPFWREKIERNRARDLRDLEALRGAGWRVCVVWECALRDRGFRDRPEELLDPLCAWLEGRRTFLELFGRAAREGGAAAGQGQLWRGRNDSASAFAAERTAAYRGLASPRSKSRGRT